MAQYEVWCHHCDVTFPAKTRRCLHCGGPTSPNRLQQSMREPPAFISIEGLPPSLAAAPSTSRPQQALRVAPESALEDLEADGEEGLGKRSLLRAGMSVVWMILLAAGYLWKSCSG